MHHESMALMTSGGIIRWRKPCQMLQCSFNTLLSPQSAQLQRWQHLCPTKPCALPVVTATGGNGNASKLADVSFDGWAGIAPDRTVAAKTPATASTAPRSNRARVSFAPNVPDQGKTCDQMHRLAVNLAFRLISMHCRALQSRLEVSCTN
jgi:hypothetical protein